MVSQLGEKFGKCRECDVWDRKRCQSVEIRICPHAPEAWKGCLVMLGVTLFTKSVLKVQWGIVTKWMMLTPEGVERSEVPSRHRVGTHFCGLETDCHVGACAVTTRGSTAVTVIWPAFGPSRVVSFSLEVLNDRLIVGLSTESWMAARAENVWDHG